MQIEHGCLAAPLGHAVDDDERNGSSSDDGGWKDELLINILPSFSCFASNLTHNNFIFLDCVMLGLLQIQSICKFSYF